MIVISTDLSVLLRIYIKKEKVYDRCKAFSIHKRTKKAAEGKELFQKKPLGRRWYLMSSSARGCEFSTATSGTERERGFVGILPCCSEPLTFK